MTELVSFTQEGGIGTIVLNNPPVNALSYDVRVGLGKALAAALADDAVKAIVLCCEGRTFVAGADIKEFGKPPRDPDVPELVEAFGAANKPIVAALHGTALGGGLELALACSYRIAHFDTRLGFPEVTLGILPGGGGTQRLPRLVGMPAALELVVGGAPVSAARAAALKLVDAVVQGDLRAEARAFAARALGDGLPVRRTSELVVPPADPEQLDAFERAVRERSHGRLAPLHCVRAIRAAAELSFADGLKRERELFRELMASPQARALRHVFFAERELARVPGMPEGTRPRELRSAAVVGAGKEGVSLAMALADAGFSVTLFDTSHAELERGMAEVRGHYARAVEAERLRPEAAVERSGRIRPSVDERDLGAADLVVEAGPEDLGVKQATFSTLGRVCKTGAIIATTTRFLDVTRITEPARRAADIVGLAFDAPALEARLLEVAKTPATAPDVWATALKLGKTLGKVAVPVLAAPGGIGAAMAAELWREACSLVEDGAQAEQVDHALVEFGFAEGPFVALERLGLPRQATRTGEARRAVGDAEIVERCLQALINAGAKLVEAGTALRASDIDLVWVRAYGFPSYRGGPLFHADELGLRQIKFHARGA